MTIQNALIRVGWVLTIAAAVIGVAVITGTGLIAAELLGPPETGLRDTLGWYSDTARIGLLGVSVSILTALVGGSAIAVGSWLSAAATRSGEQVRSASW